jgi:methylated-DNA-protein-cysteine methyltransferase-like protein
MKSVRSEIPPEHAAIHAAIAAIPLGQVASYGEIARRAGLPRRARLVGRVLRETPPGIELPWHRVLRADGRIAFASGSRSFREQVRRLAAEGVPTRNGRIDIQLRAGGRDMDRALWGPV